MHGFLVTVSAVLLAIALAGLALTWQPPTYRGVGVAFTATFARHGGERYAVVVESPAALRLASSQRRQLLATVARRIGGPLVSG